MVCFFNVACSARTLQVTSFKSMAILVQGTGDLLDLGLLQKDGNGYHLNVLG